MKRVLSIILTLVMILSASVIPAFAVSLDVYGHYLYSYTDGPGEGYIEDGTTIHITDPQAMVYFISQTWAGKNYAVKRVVLDNDIIFDSENAEINALINSAYKKDAGENRPFKGTLDGQGHKVQYLDDYAVRIGGLFCALDGATIQNIDFVDFNARDHGEKSGNTVATGYIAAFVYGNTKIENVTFKANDQESSVIKGTENIGGLVGVVKDDAKLTINNCILQDVDVSVRSTNCGGFVGRICDGAKVTIADSSFSGDVIVDITSHTVIESYKIDHGSGGGGVSIVDTAGKQMGGLVGYMESSSSLSIDNCKNNANVAVTQYTLDVSNLTQGNNGGLVGICYGNVTINNSINNGDVLAQGRSAGGLVGLVDGSGTAEVYNSTNTGNVTAQDSAGGIIGYFGNRDADNSIVIKNCTNAGDVKSEKGYAAGIAAMIDSDASEASPHIFAGNSNSAFIYGNKYAGGIVALNYGYAKFEDCKNLGRVSAENEMAAGILAWSEDDDVSFENCYNSSDSVVTANNETAGIIGYFGNRDRNPKFSARNCSNDGLIYSITGRAGGIAARLDSNGKLYFTNVDNNGAVYGGWNAGGICGESEGCASFTGVANNGTVISNNSGAGGILAWNSDDELIFIGCKNTGDITGKEETGGILGFTGSDDGDRDMYFEDCTNSGRIESKSSQAAGIAAKVDTDGTHTFKNVSNTKEIVGGWSAGGVCADIMGATTFTNATNSGSVTAKTKNAGGILSWSENQPVTFTGCSNSGAIYGKEYAGGIGGVMNDEAADPEITVGNCKNSGSVTSQNSDVGGIIGALLTDGDCRFTNCKNEGGGIIKGAREAGGIFGYTCGNYTLIKNCSNSGKISTTGLKEDDFYAGTLYGLSENGVTCEGCKNATASIFTEYSTWIIIGCAAVVMAAVAVLIARKKKTLPR